MCVCVCVCVCRCVCVCVCTCVCASMCVCACIHMCVCVCVCVCVVCASMCVCVCACLCCPWYILVDKSCRMSGDNRGGVDRCRVWSKRDMWKRQGCLEWRPSGNQLFRQISMCSDQQRTICCSYSCKLEAKYVT